VQLSRAKHETTLYPVVGPEPQGPAELDLPDREASDGYAQLAQALSRAGEQLTAADRTLQEALEALDASCTRRRSEVLLELALVQLEREDIDEACRFATQSYEAAVEAGSVLGQRRVGAFRSRLDRWSDAEAVRNLDERLAGLL
jgi:ribosomal protein L12E/L44/L45/RPP1/RPP2